MITSKKLAKTFLLAILPLISFSQRFWETSAGFGATHYLGDMVQPAFTFTEGHFAVQANLKRYFDAKHAIRLNVLAGKISGNDFQYDRISSRGTAFRAPLLEVSLMGELDLRGHKRFPKNGVIQQVLSPYIFVGLAATFAQPRVIYTTPGNKDAAIDYAGIHLAVPVGGGLKIDVGESVYLGIEAGLRFTASDNIDGVQESGNAYNNDVYFFGGLSAGYRLLRKAMVKAEKM